ncbi:serine hydrolase domain-containing protein [Sphingosinicella rhizophila]|uniref:Serine hydrolase domain-containing protein n=1 Tax=Sphingosinicella rhizophila TaxID=3050082 RepID=A0ABU3QBH5_9SPHN|nr:serine hydrolase domain-containing protein [Sphingosinicella sp. GR2756]MDT9600672.1 serine hydrolase domain-containing protein [Sphingosinicella sp. GR2756]
MKSGLLSFALLLGTALAAPLAINSAAPAAAQAASGSQTLTPATIAAIDSIAKEAVRSGQTAGLAVGVSVNGSPVLVRGYGAADLEHGVPVTQRTVFRTGSVTKQFTAAAILLLAEDGKLSVDDPLSKFFPDFPRASEVTVRELLTHTGGVRNYTAVEDYFPTLGRQDLTTEQMVDYIAKLEKPYDFDPGTSWSYSNSGYFLLGAIIEKLSGQSYAAFMKARIFDPLGLSDTAVDDTTELVPHRADGYEVVKDAPGKYTNTTYIAMGAAAAAGAIRSTVGDLLKWQNALLGGKLLKPGSLAMMIEPVKLKNGSLSGTARKPDPAGRPPSEYGFGLSMRTEDGRRVIGHGGNINGFNSYTQNFPDQKVSIAVLANTGGRPAGEAGTKIAEAIFGTKGK